MPQRRPRRPPSSIAPGTPVCGHAEVVVCGAGVSRSARRLFLLDYDGTLTPQDGSGVYDARPDARPNEEVLGVLRGLCADPRNTVYIISGRGRAELRDWFSSVVRARTPKPEAAFPTALRVFGRSSTMGYRRESPPLDRMPSPTHQFL